MRSSRLATRLLNARDAKERVGGCLKAGALDFAGALGNSPFRAN